ADFEAVAADIEQLAATEEDSDAIVRGAVEAIHDRLDTYSWVGIYFVEDEELVLGPWQGPSATDHVRVPIGQGVCGAAAASGVAEIDVDSDAPAAFGEADRVFLERVATAISAACLVGWDTGGMDWDAPENWA